MIPSGSGTLSAELIHQFLERHNMKKKIVIIDSDGRETVVEGNFDKAVNVRLETEPEKYWFSVKSCGTGHFRTLIDSDCYPEFLATGSESKKQAILNYIGFIVKFHGDKGFYWIERELEGALKELKNHE